jgi:hypothetical protein
MALASLNFSMISRAAAEKSANSVVMDHSIFAAPESSHAKFLRSVATYHSSWYEVRLAEFRRSTEENK